MTLFPHKTVLAPWLALLAGLGGCSEESPDASPGAPSAGTPAAKAHPRVRTDAPTFDFGRLLKGQVETAEFTLRNEGDAPAVVQMIQTVCGCTVARLVLPDGTSFTPPKGAAPDPSGIATIPAGESISLFVELETGAQKPGPLSKSVTVHSNDPLNGRLGLRLQASIVEPFHVEPPEVVFGEVRRGETPAATVEISAAALEGAAVVGVDSLPEWLEADVRRLEGTGRFALDVRLREGAPVGFLKADVRARVDHPTFDGLDVPVFATVKSRLRFDTGNPTNRERIDFGFLPRGEPTTITVEVAEEVGAAPFRVTGVEVDAARADLVETEVETLEDGRRYRVLVTCAPTGDVRNVRGTLRIRTDHPDQPVKELPFQAWVDSNP
ncbi:MAG: DUF1573 domain-containing protein [Planctomycetota bacterium JB042]